MTVTVPEPGYEPAARSTVPIRYTTPGDAGIVTRSLSVPDRSRNVGGSAVTCRSGSNVCVHDVGASPKVNISPGTDSTVTDPDAGCTPGATSCPLTLHVAPPGGENGNSSTVSLSGPSSSVNTGSDADTGSR